jgi:AcrR family transcriptional regulator
MGRRAGVSADETRGRLLGAAVRVFSARGYEGSRVSEIAAEAGLSTGAIYAHFGTKTDLLCAAIRARGPAAIAGLVDSEAAGSVGSVLRFLGHRLGTGRRSPKADAVRAVLIESLAASRREPQVAEVLRESLGAREAGLTALIRRGQEAGEVRRDASAPAVARLCMLLVLGAVTARQLELPAPDQGEWEAVIDSLVENLEPAAAR